MSCAVLGLPRSSYYHRAKRRDQKRLREAIEGIDQMRTRPGPYAQSS